MTTDVIAIALGEIGLLDKMGTVYAAMKNKLNR